MKQKTSIFTQTIKEKLQKKKLNKSTNKYNTGKHNIRQLHS